MIRKLIKPILLALSLAAVGACGAHAHVGPAHAGAGVS
jgi:hypothetical protein